jgi:pyroglutamyl-peptidase
MKKILLCAFDAFGGESVNPASLAVERVSLDGVIIEKCTVPTVFYKSIDLVTARIDAFLPDAVVMIGQAGGRDKIAPERVAINVSDARIDDNEGNRPCDEPIVAGGPAAYFSTLPIKSIVSELIKEGIPSTVSDSAGTFVCNHLMYGVLHHIKKRGLSTRAGFIHIPYLPEQAAKKPTVPSLPLDVDIRGIEIAIKTVVSELCGGD